jgi:transcriptional regulator with GAF, ATPase, and Fis domain
LPGSNRGDAVDEWHWADVMAEVAHALNMPEALEDVLDRLVRAACTAIPGVDYAGVSIGRHNGINTVAASDPVAEHLDRLQYALDQGPGLDAIRSHTAVVVTDMAAERRWPRFALKAAQLGVLSQMGIEMFADETTVGGLNLYATRREAFDEGTRHAAMLFAVHAALALNKTMRVAGLVEALQTRQRIGQAVGIVMHKFTMDEQAAFGYLVQVCRDSNVRMEEVAVRITGLVSAPVASVDSGGEDDRSTTGRRAG